MEYETAVEMNEQVNRSADTALRKIFTSLVGVFLYACKHLIRAKLMEMEIIAPLISIKLASCVSGKIHNSLVFGIRIPLQI